VKTPCVEDISIIIIFSLSQIGLARNAVVGYSAVLRWSTNNDDLQSKNGRSVLFGRITSYVYLT